MQNAKLRNLSIKDAQKVSSVELTQYYLSRIKAENPKLNAFLTVCEKEALEQAEEADRRKTNNQQLGPLDGVPIAIKDNISTRGLKTTAGSKILKDFIPPYDATVISKLKKAGAVILGKTNMDEFAMGSSTENSAFGPTKNPVDTSRVPGGSSGGSAAAVAGDLCVAALGSDTGGSIRQPASLCGLVGFKPSYSAVSRYGLIAMASSLDQIGPLTKSVEDAEILFDVIRGYDRYDATSSNLQPTTYNLQPLKIGLIDADEGLDGPTKTAFGKAIEALKKKYSVKTIGSELQEALDVALATYYIIVPAEVSANLARFDGVKYGLRKRAKNLLEQYLATRAEGLGAEVKRRIILGTYVLSSGYYDAYYKSAQSARAMINAAFEETFKEFNVIVSPTSPTVAFKLGEKTSDPLTMYLSDIFTVPVNIAGLPAISIPCKTSGLPVGLQLIGPAFGDEKLLAIAQQIEKII